MRGRITASVVAGALTAATHAQPVQDLTDGEQVKVQSVAYDFTVSGFVSDSGSIDEPGPIACVPKDAGSLDITVNLADLGAPFEQQITLAGEDLGDGVVQWTADETIDECVTVDFDGQQIDVLISDVQVMLTAQAESTQAFNDPDCGAALNVSLEQTGGDEVNFIHVQAFAFCTMSGLTEILFDSQNLMFTGFGGGGVPADLNADGVIGGADLGLMLGAWGPCPDEPGACPADLNADGTVGGADLGLLLGQWGSTTP